MTSSRPTDDCLALLELLLWNHLLRSPANATGAGQPLAETSTPTGNYLDWMAMRGLVRREQLLGEAFRSGDLQVAGTPDQVAGTPDLHPGRSPLALTDAGARFAVQALRREGKVGADCDAAGTRHPARRTRLCGANKRATRSPRSKAPRPATEITPAELGCGQPGTASGRRIG